MPFNHRVCLLGFSDFERRALAMQFGLAGTRTPSYTLVATPPEARFLVVDADARTALQRALEAGRLADTLFVGGTATPAGALARLKRPIDALSLLRELDTVEQAAVVDDANAGGCSMNGMNVSASTSSIAMLLMVATALVSTRICARRK